MAGPLSSIEFDVPDEAPPSDPDGSLMDWLQAPHTKRFIKKLQENELALRQALTLQCADSSDPKVRAAHGAWGEAKRTLDNVRELIKEARG